MSETPALRPSIDPAVFQAFDRLDDDQIVAEMRGATLKEYVYEFQQDGQTVRGLSKAGTDDASRHMALKYGETLREKDVVVEFQDADYAYFKAWAERVMVNNDGREVVLDAVVGQKRQPKFNTSRKTGEKWPNAFWYEQGGQKALRNAKQKLIPEPIKLALIDAYSKAGKTKQITSGDLPISKSPPPSARAEPTPRTAKEADSIPSNPSTGKPYTRVALVKTLTAAEQRLEDAAIAFPPWDDSQVTDLQIWQHIQELWALYATAQQQAKAAADAEQMALASDGVQP